MSYDRIWIKSNNFAEKWVERRQADRNKLGVAFDYHFDRLRQKGDYVVLVAGENLCFDELFLSDAPSALRVLYDHGHLCQQYE